MLRSDRLILRELNGDDLDVVAEMLGDPRVMRYWPQPLTPDQVAAWIERQQARYAKDGHGYWIAILRNTNTVVGQAGVISMIIENVLEFALGYIIHRPYWRQGLATEAAQTCLDYIFECHNKAIAPIRPENTPSIGVALKLGMRVEKRIMHAGYEHDVYALTTPEPR